MKILSILLFSTILVSCGTVTGTKEGDSTITGAVIGGLIGNQFGHGSGRAAATLIGAVVGSQLGKSVGKQMDERDMLLAESATQTALEHTRDKTTSSWNNPNNGHKGDVYIERTSFNEQAQPCREFTHTVIIGDSREKVYGTACRTADGEWKLQ